jgi:hypothetical protein
MPNKNPTGYKKPYTIYSDNDKMDTSGMSNEPPMEMSMEEVITMTIGPITKYGMGGKVDKKKYYGKGGKVYTDKNDEDTLIKMKDLKT